ncbi:lyase [Vibrio sp. 10N.286.49.C2]|uniref:polysaccharide lyase family 7 protein n=1 Tax=unclassified Vibrio TaxID=2614977 RepID=UPI000C83F3A1|nr:MULTISPECIES: polysaccharide lyase family 7 protein [unclassified Vibrio]PMH36787.1 lyase [Vibrio sp. 10N.286.49.C2]PMH54920.1 lyase [Vibrio sp. 10N.286.49.B1]
MKSNTFIMCSLISSALMLSGCGGEDGSSPSSPNTGTDPVAPYTQPRYQAILAQSNLQVSDPEGMEGNHTTVVRNGEFVDYYSDHFYSDASTEHLTFKMSGYKLRSELRLMDNFDTSEQGKQRELHARLQPIDVEVSLSNSNSDNDEVTYLQIHNTGLDEQGTGAIPHPLLRVVYEAERDGFEGHYWAVLKINALDCSAGSEDEHLSDCNNAYERINLGKANLSGETDMRLLIRESELVIEVDSQVIATRDISYWAPLLSYFKAGVYNQFEHGEAEVQYPLLTAAVSDYSAENNWDIDQWKITIPASKNDWYGSGGTSAAELEPAHCRSDKEVLSNDSELWYSDAAVSFFDVGDGRMHFRANMGYGTTTTNSNYIRSELRELFNAQKVGSCSTSSSNTSWFINDSATDTSTHLLTSTVRIEDYPDNISLPKVIVGQVHGWEIKQALVKVQWEGSNKPVRVILNQDFFKGNVSCDSDNPINNCDNWSFSVDMGTYPAYTDWQYVIEVNEQGIRLETQNSDLNGADSNNKVTRFLTWGEVYSDTNNGDIVMSEQWTSDDVAYYFKAGIYPQFKPEEKYNNKFFSVSFDEVTIRHY